MTRDRSRDGEPSRSSRREFLRDAGIAAGAVGAWGVPAAAAAPRRRHGHRLPRRIRASVAILGGGMGGLAAAHELAERGFKVTVVEPKALGGKARSIPYPGTGTGGRADLPGEHGFRFFPGFYKNIPDTMRRIPYPGNPNGVFDNLVAANQELLAFGVNDQAAVPELRRRRPDGGDAVARDRPRHRRRGAGE